MSEFTKKQLDAIKIVDSLYKTKADIDFAFEYFANNRDKIICIKTNEETQQHEFHNAMPKILCDLIGMIKNGELILKENNDTII